MDKQSKKDYKAQYRNRAVTGGVYRVRCESADTLWLRSTTDMQGAKNRLMFAVSTKLCPEAGMLKEWKQFGAAAFSFEILEEIEKKETQSAREFSQDVDTLLELWAEKLRPGQTRK